MDIESNVYKVLTKRRYNRDEPYLKDQLKERFRNFIKHNEPIKLVGFWGVGHKGQPNSADVASCKFLSELNDEVKAVYPPGIRFIFIFATLHGIHNGVPQEDIKSYTKAMESILSEHGFEFIYLDPLWEKYGISFEKIDKLWDEKKEGWWDDVEYHEKIEVNAQNRNRRLEPRVAAQKYYIMRNLEKEMLETEFPDSIFHAFSDSSLRCVLPDMPTLYFYARKGWSDTPWFVTDDK